MIDRLSLHATALGAASPAGIGAEDLTQSNAPGDVPMALASSPSRSFPVFPIDRSHPRWKRWAEEPRLRRASALSHYLAEAIDQALTGAGDLPRSRMGLVAVFNNGSIAHTMRFYAGYRGQGRRFASPLLFPETVYNAATSHAAAVFGLGGPSCTIVGDEAAWVEGIRMAKTWLALGHVSSALVAAAEEITSVTLDAFLCARWLRKGRPFRPAEGAVALLLTSHTESPLFTIESAPVSLSYRNRDELPEVASLLVQGLPPNVPIYPTAQGSWLGPIEEAALRSFPTIQPYPYLGDAFAVAAGWQTIRASTLLYPERPEILVPIWGSSHQLSWLHLRFVRCAGQRTGSHAPAS